MITIECGNVFEFVIDMMINNSGHVILKL